MSALAAFWRRQWAALARIRVRLLLVNLIVVGVPLAGMAFAEQHERQLLAALEDDLVHQGEVVRALLGGKLDDRGAELAAAAQNTRTRIRLVDRGFATLSDSHAGGPPEGKEALAPTLRGTRIARPLPAPAERRELRAALAGGYGAATRLADKVYLFVALPIHEQNQVVGAVYLTRSTEGVKLALLELRADLFRWLGVALAATVVLSLFLAATIARPLARLTRQAERVAAGERPVALAASGHDEIAQLSRAVERMAGELDRRTADVHDLAADVSHGLKTPLAGIRGAAELLRDGADGEARERFLAMIEDDAARLDRLIGRLLELSRHERDEGALSLVALAELAREVAAADPHGVPIDVVGESIVLARREALASALANLIGNAAQHAVGRVTVHIGAGRVGVHNHGPTIAPAAQDRVWERFYTTRGARGGSGLGLAIVRAVVARHGGRVGLVSNPGEGTTFSFELPTS